jgi:hypothetical protein
MLGFYYFVIEVVLGFPSMVSGLCFYSPVDIRTMLLKSCADLGLVLPSLFFALMYPTP